MNKKILTLIGSILLITICFSMFYITNNKRSENVKSFDSSEVYIENENIIKKDTIINKEKFSTIDVYPKDTIVEKLIFQFKLNEDFEASVFHDTSIIYGFFNEDKNLDTACFVSNKSNKK